MANRDVVFFHQEVNAGSGLFHHASFPLDHLLEVQLPASGSDAMFCELVLGLVVMFRTVEQRFRRNAADVQAGASQSVVLFNQGCFISQLSGTNGSDVTSWPATDDNDIIRFHGAKVTRTDRIGA